MATQRNYSDFCNLKNRLIMSLIIIIIGQKLFQMKLPNVIELFLCENLQNLAKTKIWLHTDISQLMYNDPVEGKKV